MDYKKYYKIQEQYCLDLLSTLDENEMEMLKTVYKVANRKSSMYCNSFCYLDFKENPKLWMEFFNLMESLSILGIVVRTTIFEDRRAVQYDFAQNFLQILYNKFNGENV